MDLDVKALLATGRLSPAQVERALRSVARDGGALLRHLRVEAELSEEDLCDVIARAADLPRCAPDDLAAVDLAALAIVPADLCQLTCSVPVRLDAWGALVVAMADPFDENARAELEYVAGRPLRVELATEGVVREAIQRLYEGGECSAEPAFLSDEDDLQELFAAAEVDEADILEVVELTLTADEPPRRRAVG